MKKNKNGMIELMRFVFCIIIILFHLNNRNPVVYETGMTFFKHGRIGVEFFFLVSGYLLANTAYRQFDSEINVANSTAGFMYKKVMSIFPYHLFVFVADVIIVFATSKWISISHVLRTFASYLPGLFFLQKSGVYCVEVNTIEWYIPAMLVAMTVLYPLVLAFKDKFTKIACPVITIITIGYLIHSTGELGGVDQFVFNDTLPKVYVRAFAELCAGVFIYEVVQYIKIGEISKLKKITLSAVEIICYLATIFYTFFDWGKEYEAQFFYVLAVAVALSFSGKTFTANIFNNKIVYFIGKLSLPLYLAQSMALNIFDNSLTLQSARHYWQVIYILTASIVFSLITMFVGEKLNILFNKKSRSVK